MKNEKIVTERLVLSPLEDKDLFEMSNLLLDSLIKKTYMIKDCSNEEELTNYFYCLKDLTHSEQHYSYGIYLHDVVIGFINDVEIKDKNIEVGYFISSKHWNQGYASEALKAYIKELFRLGFNNVIAGFFDGNKASEKVMIKCGMTSIEKIDYINYRGENHLCRYYMISKD